MKDLRACAGKRRAGRPRGERSRRCTHGRTCARKRSPPTGRLTVPPSSHRRRRRSKGVSGRQGPVSESVCARAFCVSFAACVSSVCGVWRARRGPRGVRNISVDLPHICNISVDLAIRYIICSQSNASNVRTRFEVRFEEHFEPDCSLRTSLRR